MEYLGKLSYQGITSRKVRGGTSQTSNFPDDHGASDMPSGLLPSVLSRPVGSNREGMPRALLMMVFKAAWR